MMASPLTSERSVVATSERSLPRMNQTFYARGGKRLFDIAAAALGLLVLSPLLLVVSGLIRLTSRGPVLFLQERVGQAGKTFRIVKFRSMTDKAATYQHASARVESSNNCVAGPLITSAEDPRITPVGRVLRRFKLDELPQLWNVLRGDMSLVGPRPEVPHYVASYTASQSRVLTVRPGITDPASVAYRHEEDLLAGKPDPDSYYRQVILPDKLRMNLEYVDKISFFSDLSLMLRTTGSIFIPRNRLTAR
jgi:lipopolysaccharide/colanic/teichoic acid biosynthesis glycosyltransferase